MGQNLSILIPLYQLNPSGGGSVERKWVTDLVLGYHLLSSADILWTVTSYNFLTVVDCNSVPDCLKSHIEIENIYDNRILTTISFSSS